MIEPIMSDYDKRLNQGDVTDILEEILEAENRSELLALKLKLPPHTVDAIHRQYEEPKQRLLHVLLAVLNRVDPTPTWKLITEALESPTVNLPIVAMKVRAKLGHTRLAEVQPIIQGEI